MATQQEMFEYLDELRASGDTNMYGATPFLETQFDLTTREARYVLTTWMKTFTSRHPELNPD